MIIKKLEAGYVLVTAFGALHFSDAGFHKSTGYIELEKNNQLVFVVASSMSKQFEQAFIAAGGVME